MEARTSARPPAPSKLARGLTVCLPVMVESQAGVHGGQRQPLDARAVRGVCAGASVGAGDADVVLGAQTLHHAHERHFAAALWFSVWLANRIFILSRPRGGLIDLTARRRKEPPVRATTASCPANDGRARAISRAVSVRPSPWAAHQRAAESLELPPYLGGVAPIDRVRVVADHARRQACPRAGAKASRPSAAATERPHPCQQRHGRGRLERITREGVRLIAWSARILRAYQRRGEVGRADHHQTAGRDDAHQLCGGTPGVGNVLDHVERPGGREPAVPAARCG